jgi:hypothetical protein
MMNNGFLFRLINPKQKSALVEVFCYKIDIQSPDHARGCTMGRLLVYLGLALASMVSPSSAAEPQFVSGELVIGYATPADRDSALKKLSGAKNMQVRGAPIDKVDAQPVAESAIKLRVTFPREVLRSVHGQSDEGVALEEIAGDLKANDKTVRYAHPNWILDSQAGASTRSASEATEHKEATDHKSERESLAVHKHNHVRARLARHHRHHRRPYRMAGSHRSHAYWSAYRRQRPLEFWSAWWPCEPHARMPR